VQRESEDEMAGWHHHLNGRELGQNKVILFSQQVGNTGTNESVALDVFPRYLPNTSSFNNYDSPRRGYYYQSRVIGEKPDAWKGSVTCPRPRNPLPATLILRSSLEDALKSRAGRSLGDLLTPPPHHFTGRETNAWRAHSPSSCHSRQSLEALP